MNRAMKTEVNIDTGQPSKTKLKQEALELQQLGKKLTTYNSKILNKLPIQEKLVTAIAEFNRLPNSHGARRRQLQFIGKLMRDCDYDAIVSTITQLENGEHKKNRRRKQLSSWCEKILQSGDPEINVIVSLHTHLERQTLRQLYREYLRANETAKPKFKARLLNYLQQQLP